MTNKYVNKKWADENWSHDPCWLYENKPKKFEKFLEYYNQQHGNTGPSASASAGNNNNEWKAWDDETEIKQSEVKIKAKQT